MWLSASWAFMCAQPPLLVHLSRYLRSWEELRSGSFLILSLSVLALVLVTLVFSGRGLLCIFAMYRSGYDSGTARASTHSAAVMQK